MDRFLNEIELNERIDLLVGIALEEDLKAIGDITAEAIFSEQVFGTVEVKVRNNGVISGIDVASNVFFQVDPSLEYSWLSKDGDLCEKDTAICKVSGPLKSILIAERTALNFLQHLSGVATLTRIYVDELKRIGSKSVVRDTRKTIPGYRLLQKRAVIHGGGQNHRMGLYDAFLVKDNHLQGANLMDVVEKCRSFEANMPLEVEVDDVAQLEEILGSEPDLVMLDNFTPQEVRNAVEAYPDISFEVSGGVTLENLVEYGSTNVKYIAIGALTHSAPALDIGFDTL